MDLVFGACCQNQTGLMGLPCRLLGAAGQPHSTRDLAGDAEEARGKLGLLLTSGSVQLHLFLSPAESSTPRGSRARRQHQWQLRACLGGAGLVRLLPGSSKTQLSPRGSFQGVH